MPGIPHSHRAPASPELSEDGLKVLTPCQLNTMVMTVDLDCSKSLRRYKIFRTPKGRKFKKPPIHILGGYRSWKHVLNGICFYNKLSDQQRFLESQKSQRIHSVERQRLCQNIQDLMDNRPEGQPFASEDRGGIHLNKMIARAAAQSAKYLSQKQMDGTFEKQNVLGMNCDERKRKAEVCPSCGFVATPKILKTVYSSVRTDPNSY